MRFAVAVYKPVQVKRAIGAGAVSERGENQFIATVFNIGVRYFKAVLRRARFMSLQIVLIWLIRVDGTAADKS
jgi:hypothetical protein